MSREQMEADLAAMTAAGLDPAAMFMQGLSIKDSASAPAPVPQALPFTQAKAEAIAVFERQYIADVLRECSGNVSKAARRSGLDRSNFRRVMQKYGRTAKELIE